VRSYRLCIVAPVFALFSGAAAPNRTDQTLKNPISGSCRRGITRIPLQRLNQINKENAKNLRPLWTFHRRAARSRRRPLEIGDSCTYCPVPTPSCPRPQQERQSCGNMSPSRIRTSSRNVLRHVNRGVAYGDGKIFRTRPHANAVALDGRRATSFGASRRRSEKGETGTSAPLVVKEQVLIASAAASSACRAHVPPTHKEARGRGGHSEGPDDQLLVDANTTELGKPVRQGLVAQNCRATSGRLAEADLGLDLYDPQSI